MIPLGHGRPLLGVEDQRLVAPLLPFSDAESIGDQVDEFVAQRISLRLFPADRVFKFEHTQENQCLFTRLQVPVDVGAGAQDFGGSKCGALQAGDLPGFDRATVAD